MSYIPPIDYSSRDYLSIRQDLINAIPTFLPAWASTDPSDFGIALLELFSWVGDLDNYYIDRIANEAFLPTAQLRSSILNMAYLLNYSPSSAQPAVAYLTLTLRAQAPAGVLPAGSHFATVANGANPAIVFSTPVDYYLPANPTPLAVSLVTVEDSNGQSLPIKVTQQINVLGESVGTSNGLPNQALAMFYSDVVDGSVSVYVDEGSGLLPWTFFNDVIDADANTAAFSVSVDALGVFYVTFGDGVNGRIPAQGSHLTAQYSTTSGASGNVGANTITVDQTSTTYFSAVTNQVAAAGGTDAETNDQIRINAPRSLTALGRCVSVQDYASVAIDYPQVSKAVATSTVSTSVLLYVHPVGGPYDVITLETSVFDPLVGLGVRLTNADGTGYLDSRKMAGTSVFVSPPTYQGAPGYLPVVVTVNVAVRPQYSNSQVQADVELAVSTLFAFSTMDFGALVTLSSVYHACERVAGVDYITVSEMRREDQPPGTINNVQAHRYELISLGFPSVVIVNPSGGL